MTEKEFELTRIKGLTKEFAKVLERKGVTTIEALSLMSINDLVELGLEEKTAHTILRDAWTKVGFGFIPATEIEKLRPRAFLTTGCKTLDALLGGGVQTREITELIGEYGSGKSQSQFSVLVENLGQRPDWGAVFVDTEMTFSTQRIKEIAKARGYNPEDIVKRIVIVTAPASEQLLMSVDELPAMMKEKNVHMAFLDSLVGTFRSEYVGRELLWHRQQLINKLLRKLLRYASAFNLAVLVSNQVVARPDMFYSGDIVEQNPPTGGHIVGHGCATRIYLRKAAGSKRIARLIDSAWLPEGECTFRISEKGIEDFTEEKPRKMNE